MEYEAMIRRSLPYLRMLTNTLIDEEVAEVLLEDAGLEKILDIQTVMIIGMEASEQGEYTPYECPGSVYETCRRKLPSFDDRQDEIQYLLQPEYKEFLRMGMKVLMIT